MRLANGIVLDKDTTFGELKFSALRREVRIQNEDGSVSDEIKERTYDLKSKGQGRMIQVSIPASVPLKEFDYNARVELINPIADTVATATYQGADVDWYIKYNEGELVGAWFTFPIDFEEVKEKIGLNDEYEEYAIHDYELPFTVDEYTSIGELNRLWEMVSELPEELQSELSALLTHFSSIEELSEHQEDIIIHSDCDDMYDVARYYIEETGALGEVPASLQNYIDYQAYGRDLDLSGTFISTNHGIFEIVY